MIVGIRIPRVVRGVVPGIVIVGIVRPGVFVFSGPEIYFLGFNDRVLIDAIAKCSLPRASDLTANGNLAVLAVNLRIEKLPGPYQEAPLGTVR